MPAFFYLEANVADRTSLRKDGQDTRGTCGAGLEPIRSTETHFLFYRTYATWVTGAAGQRIWVSGFMLA